MFYKSKTDHIVDLCDHRSTNNPGLPFLPRKMCPTCDNLPLPYGLSVMSNHTGIQGTSQKNVYGLSSLPFPPLKAVWGCDDRHSSHCETATETAGNEKVPHEPDECKAQEGAGPLVRC